MLTPRIQMLRERHLSTPPCTSADRISLFTKASQTFVNEPPVLVRARAFDYVLRNTKLHISPGELLVGSHTDKDRCAPIFPEYSSAQWIIDQIDLLPTRPADPLQLNPEDREEILRCLRWWNGKSLQDFTDNALPEEIRREEDCGLYTVGSRDTATGHITANYKRLLREGLNGYIARCRGKIRETVGGSKEAQEKINFWRACIISAEGVIAYAQRFSVLAAEQAAAENDPERRAELLEISRICAKVPAEPAGTFYEAMQFVWFVQIMLHLETPAHANSLFRFDQYMYPYYKADKEAGRITDERVIELLQCLYIKVSDLIKLRNSYYSSAFAGYVMWPTLVIGGQDKDGHDASNELSYLVLEASDGVKLQSPSICLRVCDETPDSLIDKGAQMNQDGQANPAFFGDTVTVPMMLQKGASLEDARDWGIVGCIEPHPGGGASEGSPTSGYLNGLKCLELVLHNGVDPLTGKEVGLKTGDPLKFTGIEQIMDALKAQCIHCYDNIMRGYNIVVGYHITYMPTSFSSMVMEGCIDSGKCTQEGGVKYTNTTTFFCGAASVADSLAAIDTLVFQKHKLTMAQLLDAMDKNFEGCEDIHQMLINDAPKFGNDIDYVDAFARKIVNYCADYVQQPDHKDARGGQYCLSNLSETLHVTHGHSTGASADGRLAGTPLSDNASPSMGVDVQGPTAAMNSVANMQQIHCHSGTLYNIRFDPKSISGKKGGEIMRNMIKTFVKKGGQHVQINVVDDKTLLDAQIHPENHRNLVVRIAGYMAYFTELDKECQDNLIYRTAHHI